MNRYLRELLIVIVCFILGYGISKYLLTNIRGSDYNKSTLEINQNETGPSK